MSTGLTRSSDASGLRLLGADGACPGAKHGVRLVLVSTRKATILANMRADLAQYELDWMLLADGPAIQVTPTR